MNQIIITQMFHSSSLINAKNMLAFNEQEVNVSKIYSSVPRQQEIHLH